MAANVCLEHVEIRSVRCIEHAELTFAPGVQWLVGDNGAGKTSVLEALHLLVFGRSFRGRVRDRLIRHGDAKLSVVARWHDANGLHHVAGIEHDGERWQLRLDGAPARAFAQVAQALPMICFEPGSRALLDGPAEHRRRFVDWLLFHVEPGFLDVWRRYERALKQRNALLKSGARDSALESWDVELARHATQIAEWRAARMCDWLPELRALIDALVKDLAEPAIDVHSGWRAGTTLLDVLRTGRERDRARGFTGAGAHRGDWRLRFGDLPARECLSRGQLKLATLACFLAQASHFARAHGQWPLLCLDDLASELDPGHFTRVLALLGAGRAQVVVTGTGLPQACADIGIAQAAFHVKQGRIKALI